VFELRREDKLTVAQITGLECVMDLVLGSSLHDYPDDEYFKKLGCQAAVEAAIWLCYFNVPESSRLFDTLIDSYLAANPGGDFVEMLRLRGVKIPEHFMQQ
jgi:hypothetical protein